MTSEKIKHREYILRRYINAGGNIHESDYFLFGYNNRAEFLFRLAALERQGFIEYQYIERIYTTCVVYEYFYATPGKGKQIEKNKKRKMKFNENAYHNIDAETRYLRRMSVKRYLLRSMKMPNLAQHFGIDKALHWVRGTIRGERCSSINIVTTMPEKFKS